jgi:DNA-directed RNA polymerase subunit M/transcription elongation factor TFIIS
MMKSSFEIHDDHVWTDEERAAKGLEPNPIVSPIKIEAVDQTQPPAYHFVCPECGNDKVKVTREGYYLLRKDGTGHYEDIPDSGVVYCVNCHKTYHESEIKAKARAS